MTTSLIILMAILGDFQGLNYRDMQSIAPVCRRLHDFIEIEIKQHNGTKIWQVCRKDKECSRLDDIAEDYYDRCEDI